MLALKSTTQVVAPLRQEPNCWLDRSLPEWSILLLLFTLPTYLQTKRLRGKPYSNYKVSLIDQGRIPRNDKFSSLVNVVVYTVRKLQNRAQYYKVFYNCNLRIFVISYSVCPWQAFPAQCNVCGSWPLSGTPERCFTRVGSGCSQKHKTSQYKKVSLGHTLQLITTIFKLLMQKALCHWTQA